MPKRRDFLKYTGLGGIAAATGDFQQIFVQPIEDPLQTYPHREWEDRYRQEFLATRGDSMGYSFHCSNCQGNCAFQIFAADGKVTREEQLARYPQINRKVPDANPRGCNKGVLHSQALYQQDRVLHPLKRVGRRGEGKWERISWDQAVSEIAGKMVNTISKNGLDSLMVYTGTGILSQGGRGGPLRLGALLGAIRLYPASAVGDMFTGASLAYGITNVGNTLDAWFNCNLILLWGINPNQTRIPDAHYLWEAKYNGATVVTISPDLNSSASQSSLWVPVKPGTDSFLAMSMVQVILSEKLYKEDFMKEQTDLPFLVRLDTGKYLRDADLAENLRGEETKPTLEEATKGLPKPDYFYLWDKKTGGPVVAPGTKGHRRDTLRLGDADPALEGEFDVQGADGKPIRVTTVFELIRKEAAKFPPESTQEITRVNPNVVRRLARELASAKKAIINIGFSLHKYMWGTLTCWNAALLCALTGHAGQEGGLDTESLWSIGGINSLSNPKPPRFQSGFFSEWMYGRMWETMESHYDDAEMKEAVGLTKKDIREYAEEAQKTKAKPFFGYPKVVLLFADNMFTRNKSQERYRETLLKEVETLVDVNHRMDSTAEYSDYVLPGASQYEKWDIRADVGYHRFVNLMMPPPGLEPQGEAKPEWEICRLLCQGIEKAARAKGIRKIVDKDFEIKPAEGEEKGPPKFVTRDLDTLAKDFTMDGKLMTDQDEVKWILETSPAMNNWKFDTLKEHGFVTLNRESGFLSPLYSTKPYHSFEFQAYLKRPYMTQTGRQQFYMDHDWFLKLGAPHPTARKPVRPGKYPYAYYSPHTRYGIHSQWRSNKYMMRLQRGVPHVYLGTQIAAKKNIQDGARVRVFNDVGEFFALAKIMTGLPPDVVMIDHAWEPHQFEKGKGLNAVVAGMISPLELAGGTGHIEFSPNWDGNQIAHESSVDIEPV